MMPRNATSLPKKRSVTESAWTKRACWSSALRPWAVASRRASIWDASMTATSPGWSWTPVEGMPRKCPRVHAASAGVIPASHGSEGFAPACRSSRIIFSPAVSLGAA